MKSEKPNGRVTVALLRATFLLYPLSVLAWAWLLYLYLPAWKR